MSDLARRNATHLEALAAKAEAIEEELAVVLNRLTNKPVVRRAKRATDPRERAVESTKALRALVRAVQRVPAKPKVDPNYISRAHNAAETIPPRPSIGGIACSVRTPAASAAMARAVSLASMTAPKP